MPDERKRIEDEQRRALPPMKLRNNAPTKNAVCYARREEHSSVRTERARHKARQS